MNDYDRRRYEMLVKVKQFGIDNAADFPAPSVGATKFDEVAAFVDNIEAISADQLGGFSEAAQQFDIKATIRENLRDQMSAISRTSKAMEYAFDGIADQFRFRRNMPDADLLAKAHAFLPDATDHQADFIAYGMPATFIADLSAAANEFDDIFNATASATADHVEATASISDSVRQAMVCVRILDGIVKNVYNGNPGMIAAWASASHVEKAPKKSSPPPTPPTP